MACYRERGSWNRKVPHWREEADRAYSPNGNSMRHTSPPDFSKRKGKEPAPGRAGKE